MVSLLFFVKIIFVEEYPGSYAGAGHLITTLNITDGGTSNYTRWLDMDQAVARTSWTQDGISYLRSSFCSHPSKACTQHLTTTSNSTLPAVSYAFTASLESGLPQVNVSCLDGTDNALVVRGAVAEPGMAYEFIAWAESRHRFRDLYSERDERDHRRGRSPRSLDLVDWRHRVRPECGQSGEPHSLLRVPIRIRNYFLSSAKLLRHMRKSGSSILTIIPR